MAHKMLSKMGYIFNLDDLEVYEYESFSVIESAIAEMKEKEETLAKVRAKNGKRKR